MKRSIVIAFVIAIATLFLTSCEKDGLAIHSPMPDIPGLYPTPEQSGENPSGEDDQDPGTPQQPNGSEGTQQPSTPTINITLEVRGPLGITTSAVIVDGSITSVIKPLDGVTEVYSWHTDCVPAVISLEYEYSGTPKRFSFCPTDEELRRVLEGNLSQKGKITVFTVNLYTNEVTVR